MNEEWKDIKGYEGLYQISNLGRVKSLRYANKQAFYKREKLLKGANDKDGYLQVTLCKNNTKKTCRIHKLVAESFLDNPYNYSCINHKDENKQNNNYKNLEYCTIKYNNNYNEMPIRRGMKKRKPIVQLLNSKIIKVWESSTIASEELNISRGNIISCLKNKRKTAGGYVWKYAE